MTFEPYITLLVKSARLAAIPALCISLAACGTTGGAKKAKPRSKEYFAESIYGVKASPRVATGSRIPKGGGRFQVGKPYKVKGRWYTPKEDYTYNKVGHASWYGDAFHGRLTANGEVYDKEHLSAAHPTFPLPSYARVTNLENGASVVVRVNDRGPYEYDRLIDVSSKTADLLDLKRKGSANVQVQYVGRARMDGHDMPYLMASYVPKGDRTPHTLPGGGQIASGVMVASNAPLKRTPGLLGTLGPTRAPIRENALTETLPEPAAVAQMNEFASLPDIGPMPSERPTMLGSRSFASAYAEPDSRLEALAFKAVLKRP